MDNPFYRSMLLPKSLCKDGIIEEFSGELEDPSLNKMWRLDGELIQRVIPEGGQSWLQELGCHVDLCEVFYLSPGSEIRWHTDTNGKTPVFNYTKINYVFSKSSDQSMSWGETINGEPGVIGYNSVGSPHIRFQEDEIRTKDTASLNGPTLVNVGVPHRADNNSDMGVWYFCFILKRNEFRLSFDEAIVVLRKYLVPFI